ncbi:hypothetical protein [Variovorax soli]|uniref:Uncharacterized protein n=1 Tax=Variovorax soli TaxID=376815 RepID=A0ABU1N959_9BURK|nr:hypothetical protein [Variovorax soli]MDR6534436.1 hypothetical protein [Variovorax soli]
MSDKGHASMSHSFLRVALPPGEDVAVIAYRIETCGQHRLSSHALTNAAP